MDKKANRDKRKKNHSFKSKPGKADTSSISEKKEETSNISENILPNNWSKYEIKENDDAHEGADFETLLQEPICNDSHFKFKSEQNWDADINSQLPLNKYFTLDLKLLGEGISTVPFPKRLNYNENLFTYLELESIKKHTDTNNQKYKKFLEKKFPVKNNTIIIRKNIDEIKSKFVSETQKITELKYETKELVNEINESNTETNATRIVVLEEKQDIPEETEIKVAEIKTEPKGQRQRREIKTHEDDVDDLLNLQFSQQQIIPDEPEIKAEDPLLQPTELQKVVAPHSSVDLEQWLDDILDD